MTVTANDLLIGPVVVADGVSTIAVDFLVEDASWLEVYKSGSETPLILDTDYTFTGEGTDSGTVTLTVAADGVDSYSVYLIQPKERSSDIQFRGGLGSRPLNIELDRIWRAIQGVTTALDRTLRVSKVANTPAPLNTETAIERANNSLGFSEDGTTLIVGPSLEDIAEAQPSASAAAASAVEASGFADDAAASALLAQDWAEEEEDTEVEPGSFSALHWAAKAAASAASIVPEDFATAAQGDLADTATQPGDNVSTLANDAGYLTSPPPSQLQAVWDAGTDDTESIISAEKLAGAIAAQAGSVTTSAVLTATAGAAFGAVGTYAFLYRNATTATVEGDNYAGSGLFAASMVDADASISSDGLSTGIEGTRGGSAMSGTWKAMGRAATQGAGTGDSTLTLYLRIS